MPKPLPSPEFLRKLLSYEAETGKLYWRERPVEMFEGGKYTPERLCASWNSRYALSEALTANNHGYKLGRIFNRGFYAHRVAWAISHGNWPAEQIDHINGDRSDNRIVNLRSVTHSENGKNAKRRNDNTSGFVGVCWHKARSRWRVRIGGNGPKSFVGYFKDKDEAIRARSLAEIKNGYHENHGR